MLNESTNERMGSDKGAVGNANFNNRLKAMRDAKNSVVVYIDTNKGKKLLKVFKTQQTAQQFKKKNMNKLLNTKGVESVGTMPKKEWDAKEAKYAIESVNEDRNSNMFYVLYQKKGVFGKPAAAGYKDRKDAEKFAKSLGNNHNTMILDKQSMKNVKGVDVNESASKEAMGIAGFTGTRGSAVEDFITKNELNGKKLFQYVKKGGLKQRMEFVSAIAGKPGNKIQKMIISKFKLGESVVNEGISVFDERHFGKKGIIIMIDDNGKKVSAIFKDKKNADKFNRNNPSDIKKLLQLAKGKKFPQAIDEEVNEAKFGYKDSTSSYINKHKDEYKVAEKLNKGNEVKFYDSLSQMEEKIGHPKFMIFLSNALRGYKVDMYKDPKIKNPQDAQEALYLLSK